MHQAAVRLQALMRAFSTRRRVQQRQAQCLAAATAIQRGVRQYQLACRQRLVTVVSREWMLFRKRRTRQRWRRAARVLLDRIGTAKRQLQQQRRSMRVLSVGLSPAVRRWKAAKTQHRAQHAVRAIWRTWMACRWKAWRKRAVYRRNMRAVALVKFVCRRLVRRVRARMAVARFWRRRLNAEFKQAIASAAQRERHV